ncbi:MAG: response regulator [Deltaproteobacteria bacterium]|nr:response regulator [Deltaproteobacteria bacterium]
MTKILIVDDEDNIRLFYSEELQDEGYEVVTAKDGHRLIDRIQREKPQLIIMDIKLPGYNGLDLMQEIRREFYDLPVILCSAYSSFRGERKSISANYYVVKSSDLTELKEKVKRALEEHIPSGSDG